MICELDGSGILWQGTNMVKQLHGYAMTNIPKNTREAAYSDRQRTAFRIAKYLANVPGVSEEILPAHAKIMINSWYSSTSGRKPSDSNGARGVYVLKGVEMRTLWETPQRGSEGKCNDETLRMIKSYGEKLLEHQLIETYPLEDGWSYRRTVMGEMVATNNF